MKLKTKPYRLFLLPGVLLFIAGFFFIYNPIFLPLPSPYSLMPSALFFWSAGVIFFLFWLIYRLTNKFLFSPRLSRVHILLTVLIPILILLIYIIAPFLFDNGIVGMPRRYYDYSRHSAFTIMDFLTLLFYVLLVGQGVFLFNLIAGIYKRTNGVETAHN